jgi:FixJ family two-component response regulator
MPRLSGDLVASTIKKFSPKIPIIMLTGFGTMMQASGEKPEGVDILVGKPITIQELRKAISQAISMLINNM